LKTSLLIILSLCWIPEFCLAQNQAAPSRDPLLDSIEACDNRGELARSNVFARQWVDKVKLAPGKDSVDYAKALVLLSDGLMAEGPSDEVRSLLDQALQIQIRGLGPDHGDVGRTTAKMGNYYFAKEDLDLTETWWKKALTIREKAFGPESEFVATTLYNLGLLYEITDFRNSESFHRRALDIRKKVLPPEHEDIGNSLQALGNLYMNSFGDYVKAEPMFQTALEIQLKTLGPDHLYVGYTLNSLGDLYQSVGDYEKAEQFSLRSHQIIAKASGPESGEAGLLLNNLGALYQETGDFAKASFYHQKALAVHSKSEEEGTAKATTLMNLGIVNTHLGNYALAAKQFTQAQAIKARVLGKDHPSTAFVQFQLFSQYCQTGAFRKAEKEGISALNRLEKTWGETHPETMNCRNTMGILRWSEGKTEEARKWFWKNNQLGMVVLENVFPHMSERGREVFMEKASRNGKYFQSFCAAHGKRNALVSGSLYNHRLAYKGLLLNTSARWRQKAKNSGDSSLIHQYEQWENLRGQIGNLFSSTDGAERSTMDSLIEKAEILEKSLSKNLARSGGSEERKLRTWQDVRKNLKPGEAAIEMVRVQKFGVSRRVTDTTVVPKKRYNVQDLTDTIQYVALLLKKDSPYPEMILLENGNDLEGKSLKRYQNSIQHRIPDQKAYQSFWEPLGKQLKGIRRIWFSADGIYHQINLNTLQNPKTGKYILDEIDLQLVTSTKQLLPHDKVETTGKTACLVGNPDFGAPSAQPLMAGISRSASSSYYLKPNPDAHLENLPGTQQEIDSVARILERNGWNVKKLVGADANEQNVKDQEKPQILLLSTHGYFKADQTPGHNPLINSGLLLAGSEKTLRSGKAEDSEDGILTAYEAMNLNLENTELAILSACETGLGEIKNGEGVYGLQRAFQVAGARSLIMSLWKVDDDATQELMVRFYKNWLSPPAPKGGVVLAPPLGVGGPGLRAAFLKAQKELKAKYPDPYYWGAFVMVGE